MASKILTKPFNVTADNGATPVQPGYARSFTIHVVRSAGSTDVVDVDFYGGLFNDSGSNGDLVKLADIITSVSGGEAIAHVTDKPLTHWQVRVPTVGAGNTLKISVLGVE